MTETTEIVIGVAGFQGDIEENVAATKQALEELNLAGRVTTARSPEEIGALDGLIIPGGESTVISTLSALRGTLPVIKQRVAGGMPVLGTCAGMIMLSRRAFDRVIGDTNQKLIGALDIVIERNAFGRQNDSFEADLAVASIGSEPFKGVFIRAPAVTEIGPGVQVLATFGNRTVAVRQQNMIGTAFHPEISGDSRIHMQFVKMTAEYKGLLPSGQKLNKSP